MSKFDVPTARSIAAGVARNKAAQAVIACPLADCPELCTLAAILEGKPVTVVYKFGYVCTSAFDYEDGVTTVQALGELVEVRAMEADDEFHPKEIRVVFLAGKFPRGNRPGYRPPGSPREKTEKPLKVEEPITFDDTDDLANDLGLL